ncbi:hypothetical protein HOD88_03475 [archaeon]|jgi:hypothetical protein|nr:hypothetical protein [archaeon]
MSIRTKDQVRNAQTRECYAAEEWINLATMIGYEANGVERMFGRVVSHEEAMARFGSSMMRIGNSWVTDPKTNVIYDQPQIGSSELRSFRYSEIERDAGRLPLIVTKSEVRESIQAKRDDLGKALKRLDK